MCRRIDRDWIAPPPVPAESVCRTTPDHKGILVVQRPLVDPLFDRGDRAFRKGRPPPRHLRDTGESSAQRPDDPETLLLCGYCRFEAIENDVLLHALPGFVMMRSDELAQWPWLVRTLEHLSAEYMSEAPGSQLTVNKLTEVLLVQLLRADFGRSGEAGLIAALRDTRIARALTAIHEDPARHWTIDSAAQEATLSRSWFARKFKELLGMGFFDYLTRLRMRKARELLKAGNLPVARIAERVGYQSDLSFVKAFKRMHGVTPRGFRVEGG